MTEEQKSLQWLSAILDTLRRDCPWDREQTLESLRYLTIEEVYELSDAIIAHKPDEMRKELGDLFLHLLFYSKIAADKGYFDTHDVIDGICRKLISRHPHLSLPDREGIMQPPTVSAQPKWEEVKMHEGRRSVLEGVPAALPPLVKAQRMQEKAAGMGFEFPTAADAHDKVAEEYRELREALEERQEQGSAMAESSANAQEELGDFLFAVVNWARMEGLNADDALAQANEKFRRRFSFVEQSAHDAHLRLQELSLNEMKNLWMEAKEKERNKLPK